MQQQGIGNLTQMIGIISHTLYCAKLWYEVRDTNASNAFHNTFNTIAEGNVSQLSTLINGYYRGKFVNNLLINNKESF